MVRTDVSIRLMNVLLDGIPRNDWQLASAIGFSDPRNIQRHLKSFISMGSVITRPGHPAGTGTLYQLTDKKEGLLKLYQSRFYRSLRPRIREIPWFVDAQAEGFSTLPPDLHHIIREMMKKSHTFFSLVAHYPCHNDLISLYSVYLFPCRLAGWDDPEFQKYYLYAQLYAEAITHDVHGGGLSGGFLDPLDRIQEILIRMARKKR